MHERLELGGDERNVALARRFVFDVLERWGVPTDDAVLLVSELATNAVVHATSHFTVDLLRSDAGVLRVEVADTDPTPPVPETAISSEAVRGRGLLLVTSLAKQWGYQTSSLGKTVWFEV